MIIKNREQLVNELAEMLMQFDRDLNSAYDTDVYLYYDESTQTARLETFVNVGGNSWLDDDHYTIYTDKQHYDSYMDWYEGNLDLIADVLGITIEDLCLETMEYNNTDDEDDISEADVLYYIYDCGKYGQTLYDYYCDAIDNDYESEYADAAREVWDKFDADLEYWKDEYKYHR